MVRSVQRDRATSRDPCGARPIGCACGVRLSHEPLLVLIAPTGTNFPAAQRGSQGGDCRFLLDNAWALLAFFEVENFRMG